MPEEDACLLHHDFSDHRYRQRALVEDEIVELQHIETATGFRLILRPRV